MEGRSGSKRREVKEERERWWRGGRLRNRLGREGGEKKSTCICRYIIAEYSSLLKVGSTSLVVHFLSPSLWEGSSESGRGAVLRGYK